MKKLRTYSAVIFLLLFGWYFSNINLFPHYHSVKGNSVIHSHFGGTTEHDHSDNDVAVIDILSNFQTEDAYIVDIPETFFCLLYEICSGTVISPYDNSWSQVNTLRGPPQF